MTGTKREITVYKFDELEPKAKEKVLEKLRSLLDHPFLTENLTELIKDELKKNKIEIVSDFKLGYSLGNCQGDGLRFTGNFKWKKLDVNIEASTHHYVHNKTVKIIITNDESDGVTEKIEKEFDEIYEKITDLAEKKGYEEIEYDQSEEALKESIDANDYEFLKDGSFAPKSED